jgi:flavin-dependent dehydrogenase
MVEVLISGAGPAGSVAATVLARLGVRVLIVDRAKFPRDTLCGDALNPGAVALLQTLDLAGVADAGTCRLDGLRVAGEGLDLHVDYTEGTAGRAVRRRDLDARLLDAAARAGAQVQEGVRVVAPLFDDVVGRAAVRGAVLEARGRRVRVPASVTVAADGRRSTLALAAGLLQHPPVRRWGIRGYFTGVAGLGTRSEIHLRHRHYLGVTPLAGGLCNAYVVAPPHRGMADPRGFLLQALSEQRELAERFGQARLEAAVTCGGPLAAESRRAGMPGLLLAGDAAGFVDPLTGDGIHMAIRGGMLAAEVALEVLERPVLHGYIRLGALRRREFARRLRVNRWLRAFIDREGGLRAAALGAHLAPGVLRWLFTSVASAPPSNE